MVLSTMSRRVSSIRSAPSVATSSIVVVPGWERPPAPTAKTVPLPIVTLSH